MLSRNHRAAVLVTGLTSVAIALSSGCAETSIDVGTRIGDDAGEPPPAFTPRDSGTDAEAATPTSKACIATTCPAPFATCGDDYRCNANLDTDSNNCGECGNVCPAEFGYLHMSSACVKGVCQPACAKEFDNGAKFNNFGDCNKILEDGCEVSLSKDPNNCGSCGNKCADGVRCVDGKCGCDPGMIDCNGQCLDPRNDDQNCGTCGNVCSPTGDGGTLPPNTELGCRDGQCGQLRCKDDGYGTRWGDCDGNPDNGCEVFLGAYGDVDPNHCGKCGNKCTTEQICFDVTWDSIPECVCAPNETMCGNIEWGYITCNDLLTDPENCGACNHKCVSGYENTNAACRKGVCETECASGWGDCDFDPNNGCETNLMISDGHCGQCGDRCDTQAGQPCVNGQCAMTECDGGVPQ
jgi:hypothetical protein